MLLRKGFSDPERKRMLLSTETLLGIHITGTYIYTKLNNNYDTFLFLVNSFLEFVKYLFSLPIVVENKLAFLSNHICQDPLENYFGCQRQRGGTSDNPTVEEFQRGTETLRIVDSFCRGPVRGNCRGGHERQPQPSDHRPLERRNSRRQTL